MTQLTEAAQAAIDQTLEPAERIDLAVPAIGSVLVLTDRRLIVVREGARWRPRSGVRSFAFDPGLEVRIGPARKRVIIEWAGETINVFVPSGQLAQVEALLAEVRRRSRPD